MEYLLISIGILLLLGGIAGCVLPLIPGPPLSFLALMLLHFTPGYGFSDRFLLIWAGITVVVTLMDYWIPVWGAKKFGASRPGVRGSVIGLIAGIFMFPPFGIIIGPFLGAVIGELISGKDSARALRAGAGSFAGFMGGVLLKLIASGMMTWYFMRELIA